jgi:hypothetical protein
MALAIGATCFLAVRSMLRREHLLAAVVMALGALAISLELRLMMPALEELKVSPEVAASVREASSGDTPVAAIGYGEASLVFYAGRRIRMLGGDGEVAAWAREPGPGVLVARRRDVDGMGGADAIGLREAASHRGINVGNGERVEVVVLLRGESPSDGGDTDE